MMKTPIILKDDPEAWAAMVKKAHGQNKQKKQTRGRALARRVRLTEKGRQFLESYRQEPGYTPIE